MCEDRSSGTGSTLFAVLRDPEDNEAWERFVDRYAPRIYGWCRGWRAQECDVEDVTQEAMLSLRQRFSAFRYDHREGSFRGYLKTVTWHTLIDVQKASRRAVRAKGGAEQDNILCSAEAAGSWETLWERISDNEVLHLAMATVELRVDKKTFEAFRLRVLEELPGKDVAERLGTTVGAVYMAQSRVQRMVAAEVRRLGGISAKVEEES